MTFQDDNIHDFVNRLFANKDKESITVEFAGIPFDVNVKTGKVEQSPDDEEVIHTKLATKFKISVEASIKEAVRFLAKYQLISMLKEMGDSNINKVLNKYEFDIPSGKNVSEREVDSALTDLITGSNTVMLGLFKAPEKSRLQKDVISTLSSVDLGQIQSYDDVANIMDKLQHRPPELR